MHKPTRAFSIGHGLLAIDEFLGLLMTHGVELVVDVRSHPVSARAPHFERRQLEAALRRVGVNYTWRGDTLGGRPPEGFVTSSGVPDYEAMVRQPEAQRALDWVASTAAESILVLLCSEARPATCHRSRMIEPELAVRCVTTEHLLHDGTLTYQPMLVG